MTLDPWTMHCQRIVAVLLAGNVQASVVALSNNMAGVKVYNETRDTRIIWGVSEPTPTLGSVWGWTMVRPDGQVEASLTGTGIDASAEDVAQTIATAFELSEMDPL